MRGDIKRRWVQSLMLVVMIAATTATLTLSLALQGVTDSPFAHTRAATKGPDVAGLFEPDFHGTAGTLKQFEALAHAPGVTGSSGPFPVTESELTYGGHKVRVHAEGRDSDQATLDQPLLTAGHWTTPDGVVVERSFADALGVHVGDTIQLAGRALTVSGIAVTTAMPTSDPLVWLDSSTLLTLARPQRTVVVRAQPQALRSRDRGERSPPPTTPRTPPGSSKAGRESAPTTAPPSPTSANCW